MAVAIVATDTWLQHLPFEGGPRPSPFGQVDGVWYGLVAGDGDASGGNLTLNARLSEARKEDWVYILGAINTVRNGATDDECFNQVNSGPLIATAAVATTVRNVSFSRGGIALGMANNNLVVTDKFDGGTDPRAGMPIFGDKRIPGIFLMLAAGWDNNIDGTTYVLSAWGFLIRYQSFFRFANPNIG